MIKHFCTVLVGALALSFADRAEAQPFGIAMGTPMSELNLGERRTEIGPSYYTLLSVPKPHSSFKTFYVTASPEAGVCTLAAFSPAFTNDPSGSKVLATYDTVKNQLIAKYGIPSEDDSDRDAPATQDGVLLNPKDLVQSTRWVSDSRTLFPVMSS